MASGLDTPDLLNSEGVYTHLGHTKCPQFSGDLIESAHTHTNVPGGA